MNAREAVEAERNRITDAVAKWAGYLEELSKKQKGLGYEHKSSEAQARALRFVVKVIIGAPADEKKDLAA